MIYACGGFVVNLALMDKEFGAVKKHVPFLAVNTTAAREHAGEIERKIRIVKERVRCTMGEFPFEFILTMVLIYVVYNAALWLNAFPTRSHITGGFSPRELVTGLTITVLKHRQCNVGAYVEASTRNICPKHGALRPLQHRVRLNYGLLYVAK